MVHGAQPRPVRVAVANDERPLVPAVPQGPDAAEPLLRPVVGGIVAERGLGAEVARARGIGHDVEPETRGTEVLQRRELPRGGVGEVAAGLTVGRTPRCRVASNR